MQSDHEKGRERDRVGSWLDRRAEQLALIDKTNEEKVAILRAALVKYGKHSLYCCWVHKDGYYDRRLGCTCGLVGVTANREIRV